jgi:beta-galactosidase
MARSSRLFALSLGAAAVLATGRPAAARAQRERLSMDPGWRFTLGDPAGAQRPGFNDSRWRHVNLPHDWSIEGTPEQNAPAGGRGAYLPTGIGWYRKTFRMPAAWQGREIWLQFDGIYMNSDVWVNGTHVGHRPYGYTSLSYDVTRYLKPGPNAVSVRVDNSEQPNSRWYTGSGIYRHTWLTITSPLHVAHWGVYVTTPFVDSTQALVMVRTRVQNDEDAARRTTLRTVIADPSGREVARGDTAVELAAHSAMELDQRMRVTRPERWSVDAPNLYALRSAVLEGTQVVDTTETPFGIRTIAFDKDRGFLLNGQPVKLHGVNVHQNGGAVGAAVPERIWEERLDTLKKMGVDAIRTSHNPPAPEFLNLCDRLGFLVMDEMYDEWTYGKVPYGSHLFFATWSDSDVTDFIRRDRNHPSVVLWSAGNEIGEQTTPEGVMILKRLLGIFHSEDPTRPVTTGNDQIAADGHPALTAFLNAEDVVGYNYVDRWHERRELFAEEDRHDHPDWKMVGTESAPAENAFGDRYSLGDDSTVVDANYTSGMLRAERLQQWIATHAYFSGDFMWTGLDYLGEATWPGKGFGSGGVDITDRPKDSFYLYQSIWTTRPVLHLFPHWNWPGREGQVIPVLAYTNCTSVTLYLNGRSLGEKRMQFPAPGTSGGWNSYAGPHVATTTNDLHFEWDVPYEPGVLKAVGERDGKEVCRAEVRTTGRPAAVRLTTDRDTVTADPRDVALVRFAIVDSAGTVVPTADNVVHVMVSGAGASIVALDNGDLFNHEPYHMDHRAAFNGRGLAILRATMPGVLRVTVTADGLTSATMTLDVEAGKPVAVLR